MEKVYLVEQGCYSDYRILSAFSTRELAQLYIDAFPNSGGDRPEIVEYELDPLGEQLNAGLVAWTVELDTLGNTRRVEGCGAMFESDDIDIAETYACPTRGEPVVHGGWETSMMARDPDHAIKIARDRLAMWKAQKGVTT